MMIDSVIRTICYELVKFEKSFTQEWSKSFFNSFCRSESSMISVKINFSLLSFLYETIFLQ